MDFIILSLAVWRLSNLVVNESGPYTIFERFRYQIGIRYNEQGLPYSTNEIAELFSCVFCLSIWLGILVSVSYWYLPTYTIYVAYPLALSTVACMVSKWMQ